MLNASRRALLDLEATLREPSTGSLSKDLRCLSRQVEAVVNTQELPGRVAEEYQLRLRVWCESAKRRGAEAAPETLTSVALRAVAAHGKRLVRRIRWRDEPTSLDALPLPTFGADGLSSAPRSFLLDRLCHPEPPWELLERIPSDLLVRSDPVSLALLRLRGTRGPGPSGNYGTRPYTQAQQLDSVHRWALERATIDPLGVFRLIVEEAHRSEPDSAILSLVLLQERITDPWVQHDHGAAAHNLAARLQLYQAVHFYRLEQLDEAADALYEVDRLTKGLAFRDIELEASASALRGLIAAKNGESYSHVYFSAAVTATLGTEPSDRGVELMTQWLRATVALPFAPTSLLPAIDFLWQREKQTPSDHRPLERFELYRLIAGNLWSACLFSITERMRGTAIDNLDGDDIRRALEKKGAILAQLGRVADAASSLSIRDEPSPGQETMQLQWRAESLLLDDPNEAQNLLLQAASLSKEPDQSSIHLLVLLDLAWAMLTTGVSGSSLLITEPLYSLLNLRPGLFAAFHRMLERLLRVRTPIVTGRANREHDEGATNGWGSEGGLAR